MTGSKTGDACGVCGREFDETDVNVLVCGCGAPLPTEADR